MTRTATLAAMLLALPRAAALAWSGAPTPICASPDVIGLVEERLRASRPYAELDRRSVSEAPDPSPNTVRCGVRVKVVTFDAPHHGMVPLVGLENHLYAVRPVSGGFVLLFVR